jgi:hypothetical protein
MFDEYGNPVLLDGVCQTESRPPDVNVYPRCPGGAPFGGPETSPTPSPAQTPAQTPAPSPSPTG